MYICETAGGGKSIEMVCPGQSSGDQWLVKGWMSGPVWTSCGECTVAYEPCQGTWGEVDSCDDLCNTVPG